MSDRLALTDGKVTQTRVRQKWPRPPAWDGRDWAAFRPSPALYLDGTEPPVGVAVQWEEWFQTGSGLERVGVVV